MAGCTRTPLLLLACVLVCSEATAEDLFGSDSEMPEVLTATRLQQAPAAVPGSMTVLDRELIKASGARELAELLRLVPGMLVVPQNGNTTTVNFHGSNANQARRLQVLVDGRSVYRAGFAQVDWGDIPVAIEDIERIEVFRGPNTVSYGANALMAVVNILTQHPRDSHGTRLKVTRGQRGVDDWYAREGFGWGSGDLRLSLSGLSDDGFDHRADGSDYRDGKRLSRLNLRIAQDLGDNQSLDWQLALKEGSHQNRNYYKSIFPISYQPGEQDGQADSRARDFASSLRWNIDFDGRHSLYVQGNVQQWERLRQWRACEGMVGYSQQLNALWASSPSYTTAFSQNLVHGIFSVPAGTPQQMALATQVLQQLYATLDPSTGTIAHSCGLINEDVRENRVDIEVQDTLSLSDNLRVVSGLAFKHDQATSQVYLNGTRSRDTWNLFSQFEWHIDRHWLLQGGAMLDENNSVGSSLSPRVALNYLITPAHGLRAVYSEAVRTPDMFENNADWQYRISDLHPTAFGQSSAYYFASAQGPGNLKQERMRSREVGYHGRFADVGLELDVRAFHDEITNLISETLQIYDFQPTNRNHLRLAGSEAEMDWRPTSRDRLRLSYAYLSVTASNPLDELLTPRHSGSLGWLHDWGRDWSSAAFYYGADALNGYRFERVDLRLAKRLHFSGTRLELAGVLQQRLDDQPLGLANNNYDERQVFWLSADLEF